MANLNIQIEINARDNASGVLGGLGSTIKGLGSVAGGLLVAGLGAATAGIGVLAGGLGLAIKEAMGAQEIMAQTEAVTRSTGGAAGLTAREIAEMATALSLQSRYSDDAIQKAQNLLLTFTNIGQDVFPDATQALVDMATALGTDVSSSAIQLGKALNDPIAGITALTRVGVSFSEDQKEVIKKLVETGDVAGAQKLILEELAREFGGSAAAAAETFGGKLDVMKNRLLNVAEAIGGPLLDFGGRLIDDFVLPLIPLLETLWGGLAGFFDQLAQGDVGGALYELWEAVNAVFGKETADQVHDFVAGLFSAFEQIRGIALEVWPQVQAVIGQVFDFIRDHAEEIKGALIAVGAVLAGAGIITAIAGIGAALAALLSPVGLVIAAAALLGAAWAGNWFGIRDILTEFWNNTALPILTQLWEWLQVNVPIAVQAAADYFNGVLLPAFNDVVAWVVANWPQIEATAREVFSQVQAHVDAVVAFFNDTLLPAFQDAVAWVVEHWPEIQATVADVIGQVQATVTEIMTGLAEFWAANGDSLIERALTTWSSIRQSVTEAIHAVAEVVGRVLAGIQTFWDEHGASIMVIAAFVWDRIKANITTVIAVIAGIIIAVTTAIKLWWSSWGDSIVALATLAWDNLKVVIETAINLIGDIIEIAAALIRGDWEAFGTALQQFWKDAWDGILAILGNIWDTAKVLFGNLIQNISDLFTGTDWSALGKAIVDGIITGITSLHSALTNAAQSAAQAAFNAAKAALGISSPSRLFAGLGEEMMRGMALGISGNTRLPALAAVGAAGEIASTVNQYNYWTVNATYPYQSASSVAQELRLRSALESR